MSETPPMGTYAPQPVTAALVGLCRHTVFGRGGIGKLLAGAIRSMNQDRPLDVPLYGLSARLVLTDNLSEKRALLKPNRTSKKEYAFCRAHMPADDGVFFDIGGNVGVFSLFVASLMQSGSLIAVEPQPDMFARLTANFDINPDLKDRLSLHLLQTAVGGSTPSELTLSLPEAAGQASGRLVEGLPTMNVPMIPMQQAIEDAGAAKVDLLKIDVEGFEDAVLFPFYESAPEALWPKAIVMESCNSDRWEQDCEAMLIDRGYRVADRDKANVMLLRP